VKHDRSSDTPKRSQLWVRLTVAYGLTTLVLLAAVLTLIQLTFESRLQEYVDSRFGSIPDTIGRQLEAYYQQRGSWEGVSVLIENDFPLSQARIQLFDADGKLVYENAPTAPEPGRGRQHERQEQALQLQGPWPITVNGQIVGRWQLETSPDLAPGSPEGALLGALRSILLFSALSVIGAGLVISVVLARSLTQPLYRLVTAVQAVAAGDLSQTVEEQGSQEIVQVARAFNEMTASLTEAEELRENLMADIAHELRTPLSVVQGNLRAILDDVYPLEKSEIARLYDETRLLSRLVNDLRELAQAEAGQLDLNLRPVDLAALLNLTVANFEPVAEDKGIDLSVQIAALLPLIEADPDRLAQVLRNLLSNALRHTPAGGQIAVSAGLDRTRIFVSVTDTGAGIAPEDLEHVFDRFWRADPSRSREQGGSGLGLAIAKSLIEAHGGRIRVESTPGRGATFTFELPIPTSSSTP
jgi:two-component system OmpR family sensor kinase/two-component system sensor histidine kinase BaeS